MSRSAIRTLQPILQKPLRPIYLTNPYSTSTSPSNPTATQSSSSPSTLQPPLSPNQTGVLPLAWPQYLTLRRQRRLWSTLTTIPTSFAGLFLGGGYFASLETDPSQLIMGIEALYIYGFATFGCAALGYLLGPTLGSSLFSLTHPTLSRGNPPPLETMDRAFFEHIKRNRGDPSFQSTTNFAPDFYGEKVVSLTSYRRWLRDQTAYRRKAMHGVPDDGDRGATL